MKRFRTLFFLLVGLLTSFGRIAAQPNVVENKENILILLEEIFQQIPQDLAEIDANLKRIAVYRLEIDNKHIPISLSEHIKGRLVELLRSLERPAIVSLPKLNTLKITSTDSTFSILNALPSPEEIWKVGRRLRVDAFLEGNLVYMPGKALYLDLQLVRTGTNEVLWAKSYSAYQKSLKMPQVNSLHASLNATIEIFRMDFDSGADSLLTAGSDNSLIQHSVYFGLSQYVSPNSRLRYELRLGLSFISEGIKLAGASFQQPSFYSLANSSSQFTQPVSFNVRSFLISAIAPNKSNPAGDWLSVYFSLTRFFTINTPDLTGIGVGLRSDINTHFSLSAGISVILGSDFNSVPITSTNQSVRLRVNRLKYEFQFLQYTF
ncbi:MAG: hypothetical protein ACE5HO_15735 [bacterium]